MKSLENKGRTASLYIENLHPKVTEDELLERFSSAGPITSIRISVNTGSRRKSATARVEFKEPTDAKRALETMNMEMIRNRQIRVMWYQPDASLRPSCVGKIFVKNLDTNIDDKELYGIFVQYGKILGCKVTKDSSGHSKGYGYVHFETEEAAKTSIEEVYGKKLRGKRVFVQKFIPLEEHKEAMRKKEELVRSFAESVRAIMAKSAADKAAEGQSQAVEKAHSTAEETQIDDNTATGSSDKQTSETQVPTLENECKADVGRSPIAAPSQVQLMKPNQSQRTHLASVLANCSSELQMQILKEVLYPMIQRICPPLAAEIFAILLAKESSELLLMIDDEEAFKAKTIEALLEIDFSGVMEIMHRRTAL